MPDEAVLRAARARASSTIGAARSMPSTRPEGPTARAAGIADAPAPQHRSRTRSPDASPSRSTVAAPNVSQKLSAGRV